MPTKKPDAERIQDQKPPAVRFRRTVQIEDAVVVFLTKYNPSTDSYSQTLVTINGAQVCWIPTENINSFIGELTAVMQKHAV